MNSFSFILTGSTGWLGSNFHNQLKKDKKSKIFQISSKNNFEELDNLSKKKLDNIIFLHNAFIRADKILSNEYDFQKESELNFSKINSFIKSNDVRFFYYPSSGSIYKLRKIDNQQYKDYSDRKIFEENELENLSKNHNFSLIIPRIFTPIAPNYSKAKNLVLGYFLDSTLKNKKISIKSPSNNVISYCYLFNLMELVFEIIKNTKSPDIYKFDAVDENISLLDLANKIVEVLNSKAEIEYNFDKNKKNENYTGNKKIYEKLKSDYLINDINFEQSLLRCIEDNKL